MMGNLVGCDATTGRGGLGFGEMSEMSLPAFENPPVTEVAMAVQFDPQTSLTALDVSVLHDHFLDLYPIYEENVERERMSLDRSRNVTIVMGDQRPRVNAWFQSSSNGSLVQIQRDRLVFNWRSRDAEPYPRYEENIRPAFVDAWSRLSKAFETLSRDIPRPDICEMVYLNPIEGYPDSEIHAHPEAIFSSWSKQQTKERPEHQAFRGRLQEVAWNARYQFDGSEGYLMASVMPVKRAEAPETPAYLFELAARLPAISPDVAGALMALDEARVWIVSGFAALTTHSMHAQWKETDARNA